MNSRLVVPLLLVTFVLPPLAGPARAQGSVSIWVEPAVPADVRAAAQRLALSQRYTAAPDAESADVRLGVTFEPEAKGLRWLYAVVAPFPTLADETSRADIWRYWVGEAGALSYLSDNNLPPTLVLGARAVETLTALLGPPAEGVPLEVVPDEAVLEAAWDLWPAGSWSVVPFHRLEPAWKVLAVDGVSVLDLAADLSAYPFAITVTLEGEAPLVNPLLEDLLLVGGWPAETNRDPAHMTTLIMTGVTALTRGTARRMEEENVLYPAGDIEPFLQTADLLHISNEVPFAEDCPDPDFFGSELRFCSKPAYFALLTHIGADIIELTGNHANDWGPEAFDNSLRLYEEAGMLTFGGGRTLEEAARPLIVEHNGNRLGFLGCNPVGAERAWASETQGGALRCDYDAFTQSITELSRQVDVVIVTQQYLEVGTMRPSERQVIDFGRLARAGADIVSGSQAHVPQGFAFQHGAFIHYGLGNLFFDQMQNMEIRRLFVDKHIIYAGRHISTVLFTGMMEDYARPRPMTAEERRNLLWAAFTVSGW